MRKCLAIMLLLLPSTIGCVASMRQEPVPLDHPTNAGAPQAPALPVSAVLREDPQDSARAVLLEVINAPAQTSAEAMHHHTPVEAAGRESHSMAIEPTTPAHGSSARPDAADLYTCPMHPDVIRDEPGTCPRCGMQLVKKTRS